MTLLELLVVLGVLSVLFAFLLPGLSAARKRARSTQCASNLRQIGVAFHLYGADHGVYCPFSTATSDWSYLLKIYMSCRDPLDYSDPNTRSPAIACPSRSVNPPNLQPTYSCHRNIMAVAGENTPVVYGLVKRPCDTLLMADSIQSAAVAASQGGWACYAFGFSRPYAWTYSGDPANANLPIPTDPDVDGDGDNVRYRHEGFANALFVDGHVENFVKGALKERNVMVNY